MFEGFAVLTLALLAVPMVVAKSRERLRAPGARRSRRQSDSAAHGVDGGHGGGDD